LNITIPFIFFTIAIIQIGIFINSISIIKIYPNEKALKYWAGSLILSSIGITAIAVGAMLAASLHRGTFFSTISNTYPFYLNYFPNILCKKFKKGNYSQR